MLLTDLLNYHAHLRGRLSSREVHKGLEHGRLYCTEKNLRSIIESRVKEDFRRYLREHFSPPEGVNECIQDISVSYRIVEVVPYVAISVFCIDQALIKADKGRRAILKERQFPNYLCWIPKFAEGYPLRVGFKALFYGGKAEDLPEDDSGDPYIGADV